MRGAAVVVRWCALWWWCCAVVVSEPCAPPEGLARCAADAPLVLVARLRSASADRRGATFQVKRVLAAGHAPAPHPNDTLRARGALGNALRVDSVYLLQAERPYGQRPLKLLAPPLLSRCLPPGFRHDLKHERRFIDAKECRANEEYKECGIRCPVNCDSRSNCNRHCVSGCFCKPGFTKEQGNCVPIGKSSFSRGLEIKQGEQRVIADRPLRLDCKVLGKAPAGLNWYKDGRRLNRPTSSGFQRIVVQTKRRHSRLDIQRTRPEDSGTYECRSTNERPYSARVNVTVNYEPVAVETPCPMPDPSSYCLNGGTCFYISGMAEASCRCRDDYQGKRCENKVVSNRSSMYHSYMCKFGLSSPYYC